MDMCRCSGLVILCKQGVYDAGFAVPVILSWRGMEMGHCEWLCWSCSEDARGGQ